MVAFVGAMMVLPPAISAALAYLCSRFFPLMQARPRLTTVVGGMLGLLLVPPAMVTVGTIGGGYWDAARLPGGPLVGVVLAVAAACALTTALIFSLVGLATNLGKPA